MIQYYVRTMISDKSKIMIFSSYLILGSFDLKDRGNENKINLVQIMIDIFNTDNFRSGVHYILSFLSYSFSASLHGFYKIVPYI